MHRCAVNFRRVLALVLVALVVCAVGFAWYTRPDAAMLTLREESILDFTPEGLADRGVVELPGGFSDRTNSRTRSFIAQSDAEVLGACKDADAAARADGWSGPGLRGPDDDGTGIAYTELTKDQMTLDITCVTSEYFDEWEYDDNEIRLSLSVQNDSPG
jgi:hypothetical protein